MAHSMTLPIIGVIALAGVGAGMHLGHSAIAEINPIYFSAPPSRFHGDLVPHRPTGSAPELVLAQADDSNALGTGCVGCRSYPEEYIPIRDASIEDPASVYTSDGGKVRLAAAEAIPDPEAERLRSDIARVEQYARGGQAEVTVTYASAQVVDAASEEAAPVN
jgi:hypothetical protein